MMKDHENRRIFHVVKFISIYVIVCFLHEPRWQIVVFQLETMVSLRYQCVPDLPAMGAALEAAKETTVLGSTELDPLLFSCWPVFG